MPSSKSNLSRLLIPALFLLAIVVAFALFFTKPKANTAENQETPRLVEALRTTAGLLSPTITIFAKVTTPNHASLSASITADVKQVFALQGSSVNAGDELVLLDDREAAFAVKQRQADVQEIQSQIDTENLQHKNAMFIIVDNKGKKAAHNREQIVKGHTIRLSGLLAKLLRAEAALELAQLNLQRTRIIAPFSGLVTQVHVATGDRVRSGDRIIDLYDRSALELTGSVPHRYVQSLQRALKQETKLTATGHLNEQPIQAQLSRLSGEVSERSGGVDAIFSIQSGADQLQLGRSLKIYVDLLPVENAFAIPNTALYGTDKIYKIVNDRLIAVKVTRLGDYYTTPDQPQSLVVSQQIKSGDVILTTQLPNAIENLLVSIIKYSQ